jgi:hypothetical protein
MKIAPAEQALLEFISAAEKLSNQWDESLDDGYPTSLPSFDEFVDQLDAWLRKVQKRD